MNNSVNIKYASREDIYNIAAVIHESWQSAYKEILDPDFIASMSVHERYEKLLWSFDNGASRFFVMQRGENIVGAAVFGKSHTEGYPEDGEISAVYMRPDYVGKGYGHTLFTRVEEELRGMGYENLVLDVFTENERAVSFYLRHGYENAGDGSVSLGGRSYPYTIFRKNLKEKFDENTYRPVLQNGQHTKGCRKS